MRGGIDLLDPQNRDVLDSIVQPAESAEAFIETYENGVRYDIRQMRAAEILKNPEHKLTFTFAEFVDQHTSIAKVNPSDERLNFDYWVAQIEALVPPEPAFKKEDFAKEAVKARHAIEHGTTQGAEGGSPNPRDQYSKKLWQTALHFTMVEDTKWKQEKRALREAIKEKKAEEASAEEIETLEATLTELKDERTPCTALEKELASSTPMQRMKQDFTARANVTGMRVMQTGKALTPPLVRYGQPNSWFYNATTKHNPKLKHDIINLDLFWSLGLGDFVDPIFMHEMAHQEKSLDYPEFVRAAQNRAKEAEEALREFQKAARKAKKDNGTPIDEAARKSLLEAYVIAKKEAELVHGFWNSTEDNMCDQDVQNYVGKKDPYYDYRVDYSNNVSKATIEGVGKYVLGIESTSPATSAQAALNGACHAIVMTHFLNNHIVEDTVEGRRSVGIDTSVFKQFGTPEEVYGDIRYICDAVANAQPHPDMRSTPKAFASACVETNSIRNQHITELYDKYIQPMIAAAMEEFKTKNLGDQIENLRKELQGKNGVPVAGSGGNGIPMDIDPEFDELDLEELEELLEELDPEFQEEIDAPEEVEELLKEASIERDDTVDGEDKAEALKPPPQAPAPQATPTGSKGAGSPNQGLSILESLDLSDGKALAELRATAEYQAAVEEVYQYLKEMADNFPDTVLELDKNSFTSRIEHGAFSPGGSFDIGKALRADMIAQTGGGIDHGEHFRTHRHEEIGSPGKLIINVDSSGSMGQGENSEVQAAVKGLAILYDANQIFIKKNEASYDLYGMMWGNHHPTILMTPDTSPKEMEATLDTAWQYASGLKSEQAWGGGTGFYPSVASSLAHLSILQKKFHPRVKHDQTIIGPAQILTLSDGGIFEENNEELVDALAEAPGVTFDVGYTSGSSTGLHSVTDSLKNAARTGKLQAHQAPVQFNTGKTSHVAANMVRWAKARQQAFLGTVHKANSEGKGWNLTNVTLTKQAEKAGKAFCERFNSTFGLKPEDTTKGHMGWQDYRDEANKVRHTHYLSAGAQATGGNVMRR